MHNTALHWAADNGRLLLVAGLVAGISLPGLAGLMRDYLAHMIALLLFLNAFRIGTSATLGTQGQMKKAFVLVLVMQLLIPCLFILLFRWLEFAGPIATALVIMTAASSISGAPNITSLLGHQPAVSQRVLQVLRQGIQLETKTDLAGLRLRDGHLFHDAQALQIGQTA